MISLKYMYMQTVSILCPSHWLILYVTAAICSVSITVRKWISVEPWLSYTALSRCVFCQLEFSALLLRCVAAQDWLAHVCVCVCVYGVCCCVLCVCALLSMFNCSVLTPRGNHSQSTEKPQQPMSFHRRDLSPATSRKKSTLRRGQATAVTDRVSWVTCWSHQPIARSREVISAQ